MVSFFLSFFLLVFKWREALGVTELLFTASGGELTSPRNGKPETTLEGRGGGGAAVAQFQNGRRHSFFVGWCFFPLNHTTRVIKFLFKNKKETVA